MKDFKYIGIIGSRRRNEELDYQCVVHAFTQIYDDNDRIVSGGCPQGGDRFAEVIAQTLGSPILIFYPNWDKFGKFAGFKRNSLIAENADVLIACVAGDRKGGTEDTIRKFLKKLGKREDEAIRDNLLILT